MWANPEASRSTVTAASSPVTRSVPAVWGMARVVIQNTAPAPPAMATTTTTRRTTMRRFSNRMGTSGRSRAEDRAQAGGLGTPEDRVGEDDIREPDTEVGHDDAPARRPLRSGEDRLAERRARIRIAVE